MKDKGFGDTIERFRWLIKFQEVVVVINVKIG